MTFGETVTVTRLGAPGVPDELGNPTLGASTTIAIPNTAVAPSGSVETDGTTGNLSITGYTLYLPSGTVLLPTDILTIRGVSGWQVEGEADAGQWTSPFTGVGKGVEAKVKRAT